MGCGWSDGRLAPLCATLVLALFRCTAPRMLLPALRLVPLRFGQALLVEVLVDPFVLPLLLDILDVCDEWLRAPGADERQNSSTSKCLPTPFVVHLTRVS